MPDGRRGWTGVTAGTAVAAALPVDARALGEAVARALGLPAGPAAAETPRLAAAALPGPVLAGSDQKTEPSAAACLRSAGSEPAAAGVQRQGHIVLRLGPHRYALAMGSVAEVSRVPACTRVPGTAGWLAGVANWRGRVLAVVDLRRLLVTELAPLGPSARLVVLTAGDVSLGLLADAVDGVVELSGSTLEPALPTLGVVAARLMLGQVTPGATLPGDGPLAVLDPAAVLGLRADLASRAGDSAGLQPAPRPPAAGQDGADRKLGVAA